MRRTFLFLSMFLVGCATLPLSPEGRQEADLMADFLAVSYDQRNGKGTFEQLQNLSERDPSNTYLKQLLVAKAVADGTPEKAMPYLDFMQQSNPSAEDYQAYAAYKASLKDYEGAIAVYEEALAQDPDEDSLWVPYINLLAAIEPEKAVTKIEKLAAQNPQFSSDMYGEIARLYLMHNNADKALEYLSKAIAQDPTNTQARLWRGHIYEQKFQYFLMLHDFEELEKLGAASVGEYNRMASVFLLVKDLQKAEEYFLKAYKLSPSDPATCYFLSALAESRQEYEQAIAYAQAAADYPSVAGKWLQVAFYQKKLGRSDDMLKTLREAYKRFDGNVEVSYFYALALNDDKKYSTSVRVLKKLLETAPDYDEARLQYAYALENLKKYNEMEQQVRLILQKNPHHAPALNLLAYSLAERGERLDEAQDYIARALLIHPDDASFMDTQAWILIRQHKFTQADEILSSIPSEALERNAEIAYHLGMLRYEQGRREEALKYLEMAKEEWPAAATLYKQLR